MSINFELMRTCPHWTEVEHQGMWECTRYNKSCEFMWCPFFSKNLWTRTTFRFKIYFEMWYICSFLPTLDKIFLYLCNRKKYKEKYRWLETLKEKGLVEIIYCNKEGNKIDKN